MFVQHALRVIHLSLLMACFQMAVLVPICMPPRTTLLSRRARLLSV